MHSIEVLYTQEDSETRKEMEKDKKETKQKVVLLIRISWIASDDMFGVFSQLFRLFEQTWIQMLSSCLHVCF